MVEYLIIFSKAAQKDKAKLKAAGLDKKAKELLNIISQDPFHNPPPYEKLIGDLSGFYSRRINKQHRLVYEVLDNIEHKKKDDGYEYKGVVHVLRMWSHYE